MKIFKLVIDDLEESEADEIKDILLDLMETDAFPYCLHDCISIEEVKK